MSQPPPYPDGSDPAADLPGYGTMPAADQPNPPNPGIASGPNPMPPGGFQPPAGGYQQPWMSAAQPGNQSALWSMILGIVSIPMACFCGIGVVTGIAAIVLGIVAKRQIAQSNAMQPGAPQSGAGQALAGIICGIVAVAFALLYVVLFSISTIVGL